MATGTKLDQSVAEHMFWGEVDRVRLERGWSQAMLAERVGISRAQLGRVLARTKPGTLREAELACQALGMDMAATWAKGQRFVSIPLGPTDEDVEAMTEADLA